MENTIREARLRPQYAALYPALQPGTWQPATAIGRQLLLWHLTAPALPDGERLMSEEHFEFSGGWPARQVRGRRAAAGRRDLRQACIFRSLVTLSEAKGTISAWPPSR